MELFTVLALEEIVLKVKFPEFLQLLQQVTCLSSSLINLKAGAGSDLFSCSPTASGGFPVFHLKGG